MTDAEDRFWGKVLIGDDCWDWTASRSRTGYGRFGLGNLVMLANRASWFFANGPIPPGMHVLHRCDNPGYVRPGHLFLGTQAENMADMKAKGRAKNNGCSGISNPNAKLTEADVLKIRALVASGSKQSEVAK